MFGEASTTEIDIQRYAKGFDENQKAEKKGGSIAGNARKELEEKSGKKVVTSSNFLNQISKNEKTELIEKE